MKTDYRPTVRACFAGYVVQAIVNNLAPLLFVTFQAQFGISLSRITLLVSVNFLLQLAVDLASVAFVDRIGYRAAAVAAHLLVAVGLAGMAVLPFVIDPFLGLLAAVCLYACGGGLLEVIISPIVEACPTPHKEKTMSLLHSFYCWGHVAVVAVSTLFFAVAGTGRWPLLALGWALVPLCNLAAFLHVPLAPLLPEGESGLRVGQLARKGIFWLLLLLMLCAGASEQAMSQWASTFAEQGLGVSKMLGDLAGPMLFAVLMGTSRALYGKFGDRLDLHRCMAVCTVGCMAGYLLAALSPWPALGLAGCGLCGLSVGIFWPGTFSTGAAAIRTGSTAMFALFALAGDLGCSAGPGLVGAVADIAGGRLQAGLLAALVFPLLLLGGLLALKKQRRGAAGQ
ncbi:MFS transporter [Anaerofilum sp. An201]|nr:MFS transporter [Anaerofilum sp. An201]OUP04410.1 MFS transporter [Anaerofilum sp. An201]